MVATVRRTECDVGGHDWTPVWLGDGERVCRPCRRAGCAAEERVDTTGWHSIVPDGFDMSVFGLKLDIEDDPKGGVAKIICREISRSYSFEEIDFKPGDVVLDIGAHVGVVSIYLAKKHPDIYVFAYEPVQANFARLVRNANANGVRNVLAFPLAVTADGRDVQLTGDLSWNSGGVSACTRNEGANVFHARSTTLPAILREHEIPRVKLLKIDCEGMEYEILYGAEDVLKKTDYLRGEFHTNQRLANEGRSIRGLAAFCVQHVDPKHCRMTACRMGE